MYQEFAANQQPQQQSGMGFGGDIYGNQQQQSPTGTMNNNGGGGIGLSPLSSGVGGMPTGGATANQGWSAVTFMLITFLNIICIPMCFAGTFTPQMVSTTHADFTQEISIYFNHYEVFIRNGGSLPDCLADKYTPGVAMGVIAGVCSILALFSGIISACCNQSKSLFRFARTGFAGVACVFAIAAIGISKSGFGACDGTFDTYKGGPGAALLIVGVVLTALVTGASLAREIMCPEMVCTSHSHGRYGQLQSQQMIMMQHISSQQQQILAGGPGGFPNQQQPQYPMQQGGAFPQQTNGGGFGMQYPNNNNSMGMGFNNQAAASTTTQQHSFGI